MESNAMIQQSTGICVLLLWLACFQVGADWSQRDKQSCPFKYKKHDADSIRAMKQVPYLFGGIYKSTGRPCVNCLRGGLWSKFCSFKRGTGAAHWDQQICTQQQAQQYMQRIVKLQHGAEMLQMTPCDLWQHMKGRTTWVIG